MRILDTVRNQTAVYWAASRGADDRVITDSQGRPVLLSPVEIRVYWADVVEVFMDNKGTERRSRSQVYTGSVDCKEDGMLYLGTLADLSPTQEANPRSVNRAYVIQRFDRIPTVRNDDVFKRAWL